jgi:hypothetical protein
MFVAQMQKLSSWITATPASQAVQGLDGYVPGTQSIHILAITVVVATTMMMNLRLLGVMNRSVPIAVLGERLRRPVWWALAVLLATGAALLLAEPERSLASQVFQLKMLLLAIACVLLVRQQRAVQAHAMQWDAAGRVPNGVRIPAALLIVTWSCIVFAGRWIAYAQY